MCNQEDAQAPEGRLTLQLPASPRDTNVFGDIYGGFIAAQVVTAAETRAAQIARGRVATVSIGSLEFFAPVLVGALLSFYTRVVETGTSSIRLCVEVWGQQTDGSSLSKITECETVQVAIDAQGRIRELPAIQG
ncbi:acyl-CoA thioesterase [Motiliproteus sediminis]|uniref:acyl-CoA thioesterase n=1 Tax=Motiliproteus sediminis TaxID=1468178 RepID=UPI001AEF8451|nr:hotdog domain-containing protein [Motiliproteus sediminis]